MVNGTPTTTKTVEDPGYILLVVIDTLKHKKQKKKTSVGSNQQKNNVIYNLLYEFNISVPSNKHSYQGKRVPVHLSETECTPTLLVDSDMLLILEELDTNVLNVDYMWYIQTTKIYWFIGHMHVVAEFLVHMH